jgi:SAM-dependent methyltransferase
MHSPQQELPFSHLDDLRRAYDADAEHRNAIVDLQWRTAVLESWLQALSSAPRLLELGPGTGQLALHATKLGARVHAIELSARNVEYCRQRGVSAEEGDFRALAIREDLKDFDGVYAINALLHAPRAEHVSILAGVQRCLVPGGSVLLVNWGGRSVEGIYADDNCSPPRFFSHYDDTSFSALTFEGFEIVRREVLSVHTPDGLHPQLLALRHVIGSPNDEHR